MRQFYWESSPRRGRCATKMLGRPSRPAGRLDTLHPPSAGPGEARESPRHDGWYASGRWRPSVGLTLC